MSEEETIQGEESSNLRNVKCCGARSKRTGLPCRQPKMRGKARCRIHGGKSTGPSAEGRRRISQANTIHGEYSRAAKVERLETKRLKAATQRLNTENKLITQIWGPYIKAFCSVETREEFGFLGFLLFGGLKSVLKKHEALLRESLDDPHYELMKRLADSVEDILRERSRISKSQWRKLTPQQRSFEYGTQRLIQFYELKTDLIEGLINTVGTLDPEGPLYIPVPTGYFQDPHSDEVA